MAGVAHKARQSHRYLPMGNAFFKHPYNFDEILQAKAKSGKYLK